MTVLAMSLNGQLRIREITRDRSVVELNCRGDWVWCVWYRVETEQAWELFDSQCRFHDGPHPWIAAYEIATLMMYETGLEPTCILREIAHEHLGLPWGERVGEFVRYGQQRIDS